MGYILKGDFETTYGELAEIYTHIQSFHFNRSTGICTFSYTYWPDKSMADKHTPVYEGDTPTKTLTMIGEEIIKYDQSGREIDILLPHSLNSFAGTVKTVEEPVYEEQSLIETVPYISFDENGDEVTKYKEVEKVNKVQIGTKNIIKNTFDPELIDSINTFGYKLLQKHLFKWFLTQEIVEH